MNKNICVVVVIFIMLTCLTGCFDSKEIDDLAYVIAIGIDKGKTNNIRMTLQFAVPISAGGEGGSSEGQETTTSIIIEVPTIYSGLNLVNTFVSKQVSLSHAKIIVFSEEVAREGIQKHIAAIFRGQEFRPHIFLAVAKGSAEEYIKSVKPKLEVNTANYYELNYKAFDYTGFTSNTEFVNFYLQQKCTCTQPVAILAGVNRYKSSKQFSTDFSTFKDKQRTKPYEGDFIAGNIPKIGGVESETMGLAVFDGDKMVGELDGDETTYYLMLSGNYKHSYISVPDPLKNNTLVSLNVRQNRKPIYKVKMVEGKPHIYVKLRLEADILTIQSGINYTEDNKIKVLENASINFIKQNTINFLNKTSKEFHSDICGFGKNIKGSFLTWKEWEEFNWLGLYKDSTFDIDVDFNIRRPGFVIRSTSVYTSEGEKY